MKRNFKRKWAGGRPLLLYYGWRDPATPWYAKLTTVIALLYLVSPFDLVPDVVPVAGLLDDMVITPLLLSLAASMLPAAVRASASKKVAARTRQIRWVTIAIGLLLLALIIFWIRKYF